MGRVWEGFGFPPGVQNIDFVSPDYSSGTKGLWWHWNSVRSSFSPTCVLGAEKRHIPDPVSPHIDSQDMGLRKTLLTAHEGQREPSPRRDLYASECK